MAGGVEMGAQVLDEHDGHVELALLDVGALVGNGQLRGGADLVRPVERVQQQAALVQRQAAEVLAVAQGDLPDRDGARLLERLAQQRVRLRAHRLGLQVIRALQVDAGFDLRSRGRTP